MKGVWLSIVVIILSIVADNLWHSISGHGEEGIPPFHFFWLVGIVMLNIFGLRLRKSNKSYLWVHTLSLFALLALFGWLWDNLGYHIHGKDPGTWALPHLFLNGGCLLSFISFCILSIIKQKTMRRSAGRCV